MSPPTPLTTTRSVRMRSRLGSAARSSSRNPTHRYLPAPPASPPTHTGPPAPLVQHPHPYPRPPVAGVACGGPPVAGVACGGVGGAGASQARDACGRQRDWEQTAAIAPLRAPRHARTRSTDSPYRFPVGARGRPRSQRRGLARVPLSRTRVAWPCRLPVARLLVTYPSRGPGDAPLVTYACTPQRPPPQQEPRGAIKRGPPHGAALKRA